MTMRTWWLAAMLIGCGGRSPEPVTAPARAAPPSGNPKSAPAPFACGRLSMSFGPSVPADFGIGNQTDADCFAWQEFIGLNWPVTGDQFGAPGDQSMVQWLGYMDTHQLFQPGGAPPPPWGTPPRIAPDCLREAHLTGKEPGARHPLVSATKFSGNVLDSSDTDQAFPRGAPAWIGDSDGNNAWFETHVNQDEYDYVVHNQFYNAQKQLAFYTSQNPVTLPMQLPAGCAGPPNCPATVVGAVELKAAWIDVPDPSDPRWNRYKLAAALIVDPTTQQCVQKTVALVAFHIIHKTQSQPTWIWATFEQQDNAPDAGAPSTQSWNFHSASCTPKTIQVPAACQYKGQAQVTTTCDPNLPPQYEIGDGCPAPTPTQVTRVNPIDATAAGVNATVQAAIQAAYGPSVWQHYVLVNVVWSANPPVIPPKCNAGAPGCQKVVTPQLTQSMNPSGAVANTVLETYIQDHSADNPFAKSNCLLCHVNAKVPGAPAGTPPYATDFSFALGEATSPSGARVGGSRTTAPGRVRGAIRPIFQ
jgi:hypothetical protein